MKTRDSVGEEYGLSGSSVARLLRVNHLIKPFKDKVDIGSLGMKVAVQLSYFSEEEQKMIYKVMKEMHIKLNHHQVNKLREHAGELTPGRVSQYIKIADPSRKVPTVKVPPQLVKKYLMGREPDQIDTILEEVLNAYFPKQEG